MLFSWLAVQLKWAELPHGVNWLSIIGAGLLGGIGFTVALFIAPLAFHTAAYVEYAKLGILVASLTSGVLGALWLWLVSSQSSQPDERDLNEAHLAKHYTNP